jgi:hypothetical protein
MAPRLLPPRLSRTLRRPGFAGTFAALTLVLSSWPFARSPSPDLASAAAWSFAVWAAAVGICAAISWAAGGVDRGGTPGDD